MLNFFKGKKIETNRSKHTAARRLNIQLWIIPNIWHPTKLTSVASLVATRNRRSLISFQSHYFRNKTTWTFKLQRKHLLRLIATIYNTKYVISLIIINTVKSQQPAAIHQHYQLGAKLWIFQLLLDFL